MLTFLLNVAGLVYDLFTNLFGGISWLVRIALHYVQEYIYSKRAQIEIYERDTKPEVNNYRWYVKNNAFSALVYNWLRTQYVTLSSYFDISDYRLNLRHFLIAYVYSLKDFLTRVKNRDRGQIDILQSTPTHDVNVLTRKAPKEITYHEKTTRPYVAEMSPYKHRTKTVVEGNRATILVSLADQLFNPINKFVTMQQRGVEGLLSRKPYLDDLTGTLVYQRIKDLTGPGYGGIKDVTGKVTEIGFLTRQDHIGMLSQYFDKGHATLSRLVEGNADYVLDLIDEHLLLLLWELFLTWATGSE